MALRRFIGRHRLFVALLALGALVRAAASVAYGPALMWSDSWEYLNARDLPGRFSPTKPNGYPVFVEALDAVTGSLASVTLAQHVAGLATAALVYALLLRQEIARLWAAAVAGIVLLDAYAIALEQHVLAEAIFALALAVWAYLALDPRGSVGFAVAAGVCLAVATTIRAVALFAVPVWIVYCLWRYPRALTRLAGVMAVVAPILAYAALHQGTAGGFGYTQWDGVLLYARVAEVGDCREVTPPEESARLCPNTSDDPSGWGDPVAFHLYSRSSPISSAFGDLYSAPRQERLDANSELRDFALSVIQARPLRVTGLVAGDTLRHFKPGERTAIRSFDQPITFPEEPRPVPTQFERARAAYAPGYVPRAREPARALAEYRRWIHTPRWLLAALALAAVACLVAGATRRFRGGFRRRHAVFLLVGAALAMLAGSALNHFETRFLVPLVPLFMAGGALAVADLREALSAERNER